MQASIHQLPSLGYIHKVICDCLGLWSSDNEDVTFHVSATEKERLSALRQAFEAIKTEDGKYGSLDEIISATSQRAPEDTQKVKKSKTIKTYVNYLSNSDFESIDEYIELSQYIQTLITKRYSMHGVSELANEFYTLAINHYQEFVRENSCNTQNQKHSYHIFLNQTLRQLAIALIAEPLSKDTKLDGAWPLRDFANAACQIAGVSLHKLHQFHQLQQENPCKKNAWKKDLSGLPVNTQSKQVIDRLRKHNRMKWETFYPTLQPLTYNMPQHINREAFAKHAFAAMIVHNINIHVSDCDKDRSKSEEPTAFIQIKCFLPKPSSDLIDLRLNNAPISDETSFQKAPEAYQALLEEIRGLPGSLNLIASIPSCLEMLYSNAQKQFTAGNWSAISISGPSWLHEWGLAQEALSASNAPLALTHFITALEQAKYKAGPLFIPFYIQVCAFCKSQYRLLSEKKQEEIFDRFYEGLGSSAAKYARLLGYVPPSTRNPKTLIPHNALPGKNGLFITEIDKLAKLWHQRWSQKDFMTTSVSGNFTS